jgi:hypothetical protein
VNQTQCFALNGSNVTVGACPATGQLTVNRDGTLSDFAVDLSSGPGNGNGRTRTFTVLVDGSPSGLSCSVTGNSQICTDTTAPTSISLTAGQTVNIQATTAGTAALNAATVDAITTTYSNGRAIG